ncbi:hypothetical protein TNIN_473751 [Trichonephila inaurata madagascariensis]|uniref:Uncharacterized protein n=1 Tax=Trichonephila inaurata madagascariensis TaxID=2747483 RepID=A0A8X6XMT1_9ARAC|nr:hypothetical protein TNIN_473751 [Trichonephila inaurata madagascariensis]
MLLERKVLLYAWDQYCMIIHGLVSGFSCRRRCHDYKPCVRMIRFSLDPIPLTETDTLVKWKCRNLISSSACSSSSEKTGI